MKAGTHQRHEEGDEQLGCSVLAGSGRGGPVDQKGGHRRAIHGGQDQRQAPTHQTADAPQRVPQPGPAGGPPRTVLCLVGSRVCGGGGCGSSRR